MNYKYAGKDFEITWNEEGKFECTELGIETSTPEECKAEIRSKTEKETALPRVSVLIFDGSDLVEAFSNLKATARKYYRTNNEIWVSWKRGKRSERAKKSTREVYEDTPENRLLLDEYVSLKKQASDLVRKSRELEEKAKTVTAVII